MDDLPTWVRWIIVFAIGLSPILTFWIAIFLGRFRWRKLWSRAQRPSVNSRALSFHITALGEDYQSASTLKDDLPSLKESS